MTKIVHYLDCRENGRSYEPDELVRLQAAYDEASDVLALDATDPRREQVALLVLTLAEANPDELAKCVIEAFRSN
jgi:hypothetical protein